MHDQAANQLYIVMAQAKCPLGCFTHQGECFRDQVVQYYPSPVWSIPAPAVEAAGRPTATGVRPAPDKKDEEEADEAVDSRDSPYDVAPLIGPGAQPLVAGHDQGTPLGGAPRAMDKWLAPVLPPGRKAP